MNTEWPNDSWDRWLNDACRLGKRATEACGRAEEDGECWLMSDQLWNAVIALHLRYKLLIATSAVSPTQVGS
jgi:hypothetical protein